MKKELKYLFYILINVIFIFFVLSYYFSDQNKKYSYRSKRFIDAEISKYSNNLKILPSDTKKIIEYVENDSNSEIKNYNFWELLFKK